MPWRPRWARPTCSTRCWDPTADRGAPGRDELAERVRTTFWVRDGGSDHLAMAVDGSGGLVDGVGSTMGHVLGTGALTPEEARARRRDASPGRT